MDKTSRTDHFLVCPLCFVAVVYLTYQRFHTVVEVISASMYTAREDDLEAAAYKCYSFMTFRKRAAVWSSLVSGSHADALMALISASLPQTSADTLLGSDDQSSDSFEFTQNN